MPKGMDNSTLILDAARRLFLEHGYAATSMDVVAQLAGVSKATVYARFESKEQLFAAVIQREGQHQLVALDAPVDSTADSPVDSMADSTVDSTADATADSPVDDVLRAFAHEAAGLLLSPSNVALSRIVASEATRSPEIGRLFYANGPAKLIGRLAEFLAAAMERGELRPSPPGLAAAQFLAVIVGDLQLRLAMGLVSPTPMEQDEVVVAGVEVFLRAYAP